MTRGIFDPTSPNTERSGSRFTPPDANQISQMPPDVTDGVVSEEEIADHEAASGAVTDPAAALKAELDAAPAQPANVSIDAEAEALRQMTSPTTDGSAQ